MTTHEQSAHDSFTVYFDDASYRRQFFRIAVAVMAPLVVLYLCVHSKHQSLPPLLVGFYLVAVGSILLGIRVSHLSSYRDYTSSGNPRKSYLKFDNQGIRLFDEIAFPWASIHSILHINTVVGPRRGDGMMSYLILNFPDSRALNDLSPEVRLRLTEHVSRVEMLARHRNVPVTKDFVAIAIRGGDTLTSNLTVSDVLIESMAERYFTHARNIAPAEPDSIK